MALILCLETATHLCSVALVRDGRVVAERNEEGAGHIHAERLHVLVQQVMVQAMVAFDRLNAVAVGIGPGSYTGLRIGVSAAKGYCHALGIPIIGIRHLADTGGGVPRVGSECHEQWNSVTHGRRAAHGSVHASDRPRRKARTRWCHAADPGRGLEAFIEPRRTVRGFRGRCGQGSFVLADGRNG
ncbi:MAG: tRNA (adenosine(37)-N6)-threonylcarbamoyltransferase complex dimerization subunit type 1 TsaB [Flavobacteriales bacterium]|nr:tRNA (adenosine(37)-N6)-threonylcarbamoyltransferase complex dimerization subunit type 1 TsaB [Flavobacteriales bacterium]